MRDGFARYDAPCWSARGIVVDPICDDANTAANAARGGAWKSGTLRMAIPFRYSFTSQDETNGFRCVYPDVP